MALQLKVSAVEHERPFKWLSYDVQIQKDGTDTRVMTAVATRAPVNGVVYKVRPPTRAAAGCYFMNAKKIDDRYLYDSDLC